MRLPTFSSLLIIIGFVFILTTANLNAQQVAAKFVEQTGYLLYCRSNTSQIQLNNGHLLCFCMAAVKVVRISKK